MSLRAAILLTGIADPFLLQGSTANFPARRHLDQVQATTRMAREGACDEPAAV